MFKFKRPTSRNVRKWTVRLLLTAWAYLSMHTGAHAEPLTIALFGSVFAASWGGAIVSTLFGVAGAAIINWVFGALNPTKEEEDTVDPAKVTFGDRVARNGIFGTQLIGGHCVYYNEYSNATMLQVVYILADAWCDSLAGIWVDGRQYDLIEVANQGCNEQHSYYVDTFEGRIIVRFHDGRPGQLADTNLVAQNPDWDANKTYTGMCYVAIEVVSDKEFFNGPPQFQFIVNGQRCYDPRKDTTAGGSGSHRFNTPSTWEFSTNPGVQLYHFLRGFYSEGRRILGVGYGTADINFTSLVDFMNVCDEVVVIPGGGLRSRYKSGCVFYDTDIFGDVATRLCRAAGGFWTESQGKIVAFAGKARSVVATITDEDLVEDEAVTFSPKRGNASLFTGIQGTYTHSTDFAPTPYTAIIPSEFATEDNKEKIQDANYPEISDAHQAYCVAKQQLYATRMQASATVVLDLKDVAYEIGDWITWDSDNPLRGSRTYQVVGVRIDFKKLRVGLALQETSSNVFADISGASDIIEGPRARPTVTFQDHVTGFSLEVTASTGSDGTSYPTLKFVWDEAEDPAIRDIQLEYRTAAIGDPEDVDYVPPGPVYTTFNADPFAGFFYTSDNVVPGVLYEARAIWVSKPGRINYYTDWTAAEDVTPSFSAGEDTIDIDSFKSDILDLEEWLGNAAADAQTLIENLQARIYDGDFQNYTNVQRANTLLQSFYDLSRAEYSEAITVATGPGSAIVSRLEDLEAAIDTIGGGYVTTTAFDELSAEVTAQGDDITALGVAQTGLEADLLGKADSSALDALSVLVDAQGDDLLVLSSDVTSLTSEVAGKASASALDTLTTQVTDIDGDVTALSDANVALTASYADISANANLRATVSAGIGGYSSRIGLEARIGGTGSYRAASLFLDVSATVSTPTRVTIKADQFWVVDNANNPVAVFDNTGKVQTARIPTITADKISVSSLSAISATLGNVTINGNLIVTGTIATASVANNAITVAATSGPFSKVPGYSDNNEHGSADGWPIFNLTPNGGRVVVQITGNMAVFGSSNTVHVTVRLYRNGVLVKYQDFYDVDDTPTSTVSMSYVDTNPGTSTVSWAMTIQQTNNAGTQVRYHDFFMRGDNFKK